MNKYFYIPLIILLLFIVAGCGPSVEESVIGTQHAIASTDIHEQRSTATVAIARMETTRLHFLEEVTAAAALEGIMRSTMIAAGTRFPTNTPTLSAPGSGTPPPSQQPVQVVVSTAPSPTQSSTVIGNLVAARSIDANTGCAVDVTSQFTTSDNQIYVVGTAYDIPQGVPVRAVWKAEGQEVYNYEFTTESAYNEICVWFRVDQPEITFVPGSWNVSINIGNVPGNAVVLFEVSDQ